jgi:hypothetical protein
MYATAAATPSQFLQQTMPPPYITAGKAIESQIKAATPAQRFNLPEYHSAVYELESKGLACPNLTWDQRAVWGDHDQVSFIIL